MPKYDARTLEREFKSAASLRIARKKRGNEDYSNDANYWINGMCGWGGEHYLTKDCQEIAKGFDKLDDLKNVEGELNQCTSEQEFNSTKSRITRQIQELEGGLQVRTGKASSMFGICCIWANYNNFLESKLGTLRNQIGRLKENINSQEYKHYEEIKALKLEQKQIEARMKENKRKAQSEKDPAKRALLLQLIEDDGEKLEENLKKQKAIPTSNLRFEPDKYVSDLINSMKDAIENDGGNNSGGSSGRNRNKKDDDDNNQNNEDNAGGSNSGSSSGRKQDRNQNQSSQQKLLIFAGLALLVIFYLMNQKKEKEPNHYDF